MYRTKIFHYLEDFVKARKSYVTILGLLASLLLIRVGEYLVDYLFGDQSGYLSRPLLSFSLFIIYGSILIAVIILAVLRIQNLVSSRYPVVAEKIPVLSDTMFRRGLLLLIIIAIGMNSYLFIRNPNFGADASGYYFPVHNFMDGQGYTFQGRLSVLPPGYGILSYLFFLITKDIEMSTMLVSSFSYVLSVGVAYLIGTVLAGRIAGFLSAFFITFCPVIISYSCVSLIDLSYLFFALLSFSVYVKIIFQGPDYFRNILLGFLLGYTLLIREQGLVLAVGAVLSLFLFVIIRLKKERPVRRASLWKHLSYPASALIVTAIFILIQMYPLYSKTGSLMIYARLYTYLKNKSNIYVPEYQEKIQEKINDIPNESPGGNSYQVSENRSKEHVVSTIDYTPIPLKQFFSNATVAWKQVVHITIYALVPLILVTWFFGVYVLMYLATKKTFPFHWKSLAQTVKILVSFLIFIVPIGVPIAFNHVVWIRYMMEHSAFFLILAAVIIVKLLRSLSKQYVSYGVGIICVISSLMMSGVFKESILFKNRFLSAGFMLTKESLQNLDEGMPGEVVERLKPLKWSKFNTEKEFWEAVEDQIGREWIELRRKQILKQALISPLVSYTTLPEALTWRSANFGLRAAGLWLERHYPGNIDQITIMARRGPVILFYANGRNKEPKGTVAVFPKNFQLRRIAKKMKQENIEYLILDYTYIKGRENFLPLWQNPDLARELGLKLVHIDPNGLFQVYSL